MVIDDAEDINSIKFDEGELKINASAAIEEQTAMIIDVVRAIAAISN